MRLPQGLAGGKKITVEVETMFSHSLRPYPSEITQAEKQFVEFTGSLHFYTPYKTTTQTTVVTCASSNIESYTKTNPFKLSDNAITYGPFSDVAPYSSVGIEK